MIARTIDWQLQTPVTFLIFNRPDTAAWVFEEIRRARPPKLLVVADGPRPDRPGEAKKCDATRAIIEQVDWPCEVLMSNDWNKYRPTMVLVEQLKTSLHELSKDKAVQFMRENDYSLYAKTVNSVFYLLL